MRTNLSGFIAAPAERLLWLLVAVAFGLFQGPVWGGLLQPVTVRSSQFAPVSGGNGDSLGPVVSADGRFVAFASAANNLDPNSVNYLASIPPLLNVFLRDRVSQITVLASLNMTATGGGNSDSVPRGVSTNGQFVLFESAASDLVAGVTNGVNNVFVRDLAHGVTLLASVGLNGAAASGGSRNSVMTPDGRYVAFSSTASNLVADDTNGIADVFVRDLQAGVTVLASVGAVSVSSSFVTPVASDLPAISSDGRYVAFYSTATNLVPGVATSGEVYLRDLVGGQTTWVSMAASGLAESLLGPADVFSFSPALSTDGEFVAYETCLTNLTSGQTPGRGVIFRYDALTGSTGIVNTNAIAIALGAEWSFQGFDMTPDGQFIALSVGLLAGSGDSNVVEVWSAQTGVTTVASVDVNNSTVTNRVPDQPQLDSSGRYVSFMSDGTKLTTNAVVTGFHLYTRDLQAGTTTLMDADTNGAGSTANLIPRWSMSGDGSVIAFAAADSALVPNDSNSADDVFARSLASNGVELISARQPSLPSLAPDGPSTLNNAPGDRFSPPGAGIISAITSADGRYVAFSSQADDLAPGDTDDLPQLFVRDRVSGLTTLASADTNGSAPAAGLSYAPSISADGRYVAFTSTASNLVAGDRNAASDVFVRDLQLGTTALVSVNSNGTGPGAGASYSAGLSSNGQYVLFLSTAPDIAGGSFLAGTLELFWRDLQAGVTRAIPTNIKQAVMTAVMTPDGQNVAYSTANYNSYSGVVSVWNASVASNVYARYASNATVLAISPDAKRLAYYSDSLNVMDFAANTNLNFGVGAGPAFLPVAQFSADGRYLAYAKNGPYLAPAGSGLAAFTASQIHLYDFQSATDLLVSAGFNVEGPENGGNGNSDSPAISPDGRFVAYRSFASNLVPGDNNGWPDVFLYDHLTGATRLVSVSQVGNFSANGPSLLPVFSGDSQTLFFQSWASDLVFSELNPSAEIWALPLYTTNLPPKFTAAAGPPFAAGQGPTIQWSAEPGKSYQAQYKNELSDPAWQPLQAGLIIVGNQGYFNDPTPAADHRFYRIVAF